MSESKRSTPKSSAEEWVDPDDAPELTDDFFIHADYYEGGKLVRRGRPRLPSPRRQVTLRLEADVLERWRATGPGWQTRINEVLKKALG